jgi:hypothetical protein
VQSVKELGLVNVPVPFDVHVIPALLVELDPAVMLIAPEVAQVLITDPATAVGAAVIVRDFVDVAFVHPAFAIAVKVSVTPPAVMSAALGV